MGLLTERVVVVSSGSQGVGAGIARAAAREGAAVMVTGRRPETGEAHTTAICAAVFAALKARAVAGPHRRAVRNLIAVAAEGYPFPTNLDRDQPSPRTLIVTSRSAAWRRRRRPSC